MKIAKAVNHPFPSHINLYTTISVVSINNVPQAPVLKYVCVKALNCDRARPISTEQRFSSCVSKEKQFVTPGNFFWVNSFCLQKNF